MNERNWNTPKVWFSRGVRTGTALIVLGAVAAWASDLPAEPLSPSPPGVEAVQTAPVTPWEAAGAYAGSPREAELKAALGEAVAAGVSPALLAEVTRRAGENSLPAGDLLRVIGRAEELAKEDLPVWPVLSRYLQGMAKGVPPARIEAVVDELQGRLENAASRLDRALPRPSDLEAREARLAAIDDAAYALGVGVAPEHLDHFINLASRETDPIQAVQAPVLTLGMLAASSLQPDKAMDLVNCAWKHGYRGNMLEKLGKALGRLGHDGAAPPERAVERVLAMMDENAGPERVFQGLEEMAGASQDEPYPPAVEPGRGRVQHPRPGRESQKPRSMRPGNDLRETVTRMGTSE